MDPSMTALRIVEVASDDPVLHPLIASHMAHSEASSPATSRHNLDLDAMAREPGLRVWVVFEDARALGCAAMKPLQHHAAEVKSVHILPQARGRGLARTLMVHVLDEARRAGLRAMYLETGPKSLPAYDAARGLYERLGFDYCDPFEGYVADPFSAFMRRNL